MLDSDEICNGCLGHHRKRDETDWEQRTRELERIVSSAKQQSSGYDCVVPASGGKDSWVQMKFAQELGLKPLALTWKTPTCTELGERNL